MRRRHISRGHTITNHYCRQTRGESQGSEDSEQHHRFIGSPRWNLTLSVTSSVARSNGPRTARKASLRPVEVEEVAGG